MAVCSALRGGPYAVRDGFVCTISRCCQVLGVKKPLSEYLTAVFLERIMGIEPTSTAWEAVVLPMNYIRIHLDVYFIKIIAKSQGEKQESGVLLNIIR